MTELRQGPGVIRSRPNITILDTREMEWEDLDGVEGAKVKVLSTFPETESPDRYPSAYLAWLPPGAVWPLGGEAQAQGGNHPEFAFVLEGSLQLTELDAAGGGRRRFDLPVSSFWCRAPGTEARYLLRGDSPTGSVFLHCRPGPAAWPIPCEARTDWVDAPPAPATATRPVTDQQAPALQVLDSLAMEWESFPGLKGSSFKALALFESGEPYVALMWIQPGPFLARYPYRHYHSSLRECMFVLEGEFPRWEYEDAEDQEGQFVWWRRGFYMDRPPGSLHGGPAKYSPVGVVTLFWRSHPGNWVNEPSAADENVEVPFR